ncbi:asparagine synthetase B, partial [Escherichia coli]|nr:asparagine synthetase B [Escherichia coli]
LSPAAAQPMHFNNRFTITYNGELYNYKELKSDLEQQGYQFRTASDTEVILASYDRFGADCLNRFDGMFALAIWDEMQQELFVARDRMGEKPLY